MELRKELVLLIEAHEVLDTRKGFLVDAAGSPSALAESFHGLYKAELVRKCGRWRGLDDVERATPEHIDWLNHRRPHGELGMVPPAGFEARYYAAAPIRLAASQ
jgi:hypothetical protein